MRMTATLGALSLFFLTGCGGGSDAKPVAEVAEPTETASQVPQLEAGQSDEGLAKDFLDALNVCFHTGEEQVAEQWSPADGEEALRQVTRSVAEEHKDQFVDALLVENFDQQRGGSARHVTTEDLVSSHADMLYLSTDGHINNKGEPTEGYDVLYEFQNVVEATEQDGTRQLTIAATPITDPFNPDFEPGGSKHVAVFVDDGDVLRLEAMQ